jgi:hypothetical protein
MQSIDSMIHIHKLPNKLSPIAFYKFLAHELRLMSFHFNTKNVVSLPKQPLYSKN